MPKKLDWTDSQDSLIRRLRGEGANWDLIAALLGVTRWAAIERGRRIGARLPQPDTPPQAADRREPLQAGHPLTWGAITDGTVLEGREYPFPVFPR